MRKGKITMTSHQKFFCKMFKELKNNSSCRLPEIIRITKKWSFSDLREIFCSLMRDTYKTSCFIEVLDLLPESLAKKYILLKFCALPVDIEKEYKKLKKRKM